MQVDPLALMQAIERYLISRGYCTPTNQSGGNKDDKTSSMMLMGDDDDEDSGRCNFGRGLKNLRCLP